MARENPIPSRVTGHCSPLGLQEPIHKVLVIGHGDLAVRQLPTYAHWLEQGVEVHCADVNAAKLDDCLEGIKRYVLPGEDHKLVGLGPDYFDLLCVNNVPELHLATALRYGALARQTVIQKPQDLNYPLIKTLANAKGFEDIRSRSWVHDHYRNKGGVPALLKALPDLHTDYGQFRRLLFFLTESRTVNDEVDRAPSLECGMIQDIGVHVLDLLLECISVGVEWRDDKAGDRLHRRLSGKVEVRGCPMLRMQSSVLGDQVETLACMDLRISECIEFPAGAPGAIKRWHGFDALIVVGKGLTVEQGVSGDLKGIVAEYERNGYEVVVDLRTQETLGIQEYLSGAGQEINKHHGGLNRPLLLMSPNPPEHALKGLGGREYPQWQDFGFAQHVAINVESAKLIGSSAYMDAYPPNRPLGDLLRELAAKGRIRPIWGNMGPLSRYLIGGSRPEEYYE